MRRAWPLLALAAVAAGGCGQKGPLYLPDRNAKVVTTPAPPAPAPQPAGTTQPQGSTAPPGTTPPPDTTPPDAATPATPATPKPADKDKNEDSQPPK